jgi:hypothetical protein
MFDTLRENCIFYISPMYEFSHSQGQSLHMDKREASAQCPLYPQKRPNIRAAAERRFVPEADSCTAAKVI